MFTNRFPQFSPTLSSDTSEKMKPQETIAELAEAVGEFTRLMISITSQEREIMIGEWDLQDIVSHFIGWNQVTIQGIHDVFNGIEPGWVTDIDIFNAEEVAKRKERTWQEVWIEFIKSTSALLAAYREIPADSWGKFMNQGEDFTLAKSLEVDLNHYKVAHLPKIKTALATSRFQLES